MPDASAATDRTARRIAGRQTELARIERALRAGSPQVVELVGEPGMGKTRLLTELSALAERGGQLVLTSRTTPRVRGVERYGLHGAVRVVLEGLAPPQGLVLVLDDLHWADEASVDLLAHLLRHLPRTRVLVALAYRPRQMPPRLAAALAMARREGTAERIELGPLTAEAGELVEVGLGDDLDASAAPSAPATCGRGRAHRAPRPPLSNREWEIGELVGKGHTNRQIARQLSISPKTVETHLARVFAKLGVSSRAALATTVASAGRAPSPAA